MLITTNSTNSFTKRDTGGKGYNISVLTQKGFLTPKWIIISSGLFRSFRKSNNVNKKINEQLLELKSNGKRIEISQISHTIREIILNSPFNKTTIIELKKAYKSIKSKSIAVRSSGLEEDSDTYSFAGQFDTYLYINSEDEFLLAVKKCWASVFSERSLSYRTQKSLTLSSEKIDIAIIVQQMIDPDKSGVLFTSDPVQNDNSKMIVNAVYGVGEGLVSGKLEADTYILDKTTLNKIGETIVLKKTKLVKNTYGIGTKEIEVEKSRQNISILTNKELKSLAKIVLSVEKIYKAPQDIEWAISEGKVYLLQTRPITSANTSDGVLNIWDNSNIVESYGGLTLPLTFTFARYVYQQVYIQFCELLMVPSKEIRSMDYFLKNMLGIFYGRVYYNLLNWYKLTSILPGYKYNRSFMETMMGTSKSLEAEIAERTRPPVSQNKIVKIFTGIKFLYYHFMIQKKIDAFLSYFQEIYGKYRKLDYSKMTADEILNVYRELENTLLRQWKAPIINDFLCMVHFGILKKLTQKWLGHHSDSLQNDLLCGEGNLESAEPTRELIRMAAFASKSSSLKRLILNTPNEDCMKNLNQSKFHEFRKQVNHYIDLYGYRCMNEMKLEQKDLYQDPSFLFACLKNYLRSNSLSLEVINKREKKIRLDAEGVVNKHLKGIKRFIYFWSLENARKAVKNRENTRFCRTRIYGVVRTWFYNIGRDFVGRSIINQPEDIFYLELNEVLGSVEGTLTVQDLKDLINLRKQEYKRYEIVELPNRFITRGPVYWMNSYLDQSNTQKPTKSSNGILSGIGCSPGTIQGKVKVIHSSKDNMQLNGEILVTTRTDPGWIPLYPMISGLLIERGSLLSHSAIVAREMGIPTIVGIKNLTQKLRNGMIVKMNGQNGMIEILKETSVN